MGKADTPLEALLQRRSIPSCQSRIQEREHLRGLRPTRENEDRNPSRMAPLHQPIDGRWGCRRSRTRSGIMFGGEDPIK